MTTAAAGNLAGEKDKEKMEKRRALGRGLASLLPGPRVVPQAPAVASAAATSPAVAHAAPVSAAAAVIAPHASAPAAEVPDYADVSAANPDLPEAVVWPEEKLADPTGLPPYDSVAADGTYTLQAAAETRIPGNLVVNLAITDIDKNPFQTRYIADDDALEELANSIKVNGVVQPIVVRHAEDEW